MKIIIKRIVLSIGVLSFYGGAQAASAVAVTAGKDTKTGVASTTAKAVGKSKTATELEPLRLKMAAALAEHSKTNGGRLTPDTQAEADALAVVAGNYSAKQVELLAEREQQKRDAADSRLIKSLKGSAAETHLSAAAAGAQPVAAKVPARVSTPMPLPTTGNSSGSDPDTDDDDFSADDSLDPQPLTAPTIDRLKAFGIDPANATEAQQLILAKASRALTRLANKDGKPK